ncbi:MAG: carboxypeptidase-like regulatory domain-containing protein [Bryobacteraceae bacterium]
MCKRFAGRTGGRPLAIALTLWLCLAGTAGAEDKKKKEAEARLRTVSGHVFDPAENPVSGAVVQMKNAKTLQIRSYITKEDGSFFFGGLDPDIDYTFRAEHQGMGSAQRTLSSFDSRKKPTVNLKLEKK